MSAIRIYRRNWGEEKTDWSIGIPSLSSLLCAKHGANLTKKAGQVALLSFKHTIPFFISDYTDGVDDVLCKVMLAKKRKLKIKYI